MKHHATFFESYDPKEKQGESPLPPTKKNLQSTEKETSSQFFLQKQELSKE